jgi:6-pyruvoyltetrahydropterin/6-carboxytetrahydropterin synthase
MPIICTVGKEFRFEAAHALPHLPEGHKCRNLHGHSYRFRVDIEGPVDARGFVIDYAEIAAAVDPIVAELDHQNLNDLFAQATTAENLAAWLFRRIEDRLGRCKRIVLWETPTSVVTVESVPH